MLYFLNNRTAEFVHPRFAVIANRPAFFTNRINDDIESTAVGLDKRNRNGLIK